MMAPRISPRAFAIAALFGGAWLALDRVIAGVVQCRALGCLPW